MKTKILFQTLLLMTFCVINTSCEEETTFTIHVEKAGTLSTLIGEDQKYKIKELTLSGKLNGSDFRFLRYMGGGYGSLMKLDLSNVKIVAGGEGDYVSKADCIGDGASLKHCRKLETLILPQSLRIIGNNAFLECTNLSTLTVPNGVTRIGNMAFMSCRNLILISIPNSVTSIGGWAFVGCRALTSIEFSENLTYIGDKAFYRCIGLTTIKFPQGIKRIEDMAFLDCSGLRSIELPDSLAVIGRTAFANCSGLESVEFPENLESLESHAFYDCSGLKTICSKRLLSPDIGNYNDVVFGCSGSVDSEEANVIYNEAVLYVPIGAAERYKKSAWVRFKNIVEKEF